MNFALLQVVMITDFVPRRIPQSGSITISLLGNNFNISNSSLVSLSVAEISCEIVNRE